MQAEWFPLSWPRASTDSLLVRETSPSLDARRLPPLSKGMLWKRSTSRYSRTEKAGRLGTSRGIPLSARTAPLCSSTTTSASACGPRLSSLELPTASNLTLPPYVSWTPTSLPPVNSSFTPTPSHGPMPTNYVDFLKAEPHREITREQFFDWNPVLSGNCGDLWANNYYCVGAYSGGNLPQRPTVKTKPSPVPPDSAPNCVPGTRPPTATRAQILAPCSDRFPGKASKHGTLPLRDCSGIRPSHRSVSFEVEDNEEGLEADCCFRAGRLLVLCGRPRYAHDENGANTSPNSVPRYSTRSSTRPASSTSRPSSTSSQPATTTSEAAISTPAPTLS
ncbi:Uncharacterized protein TPAR_01045 [Tolypocladium paradoxum]|uniref:Uncharacterized protein n=1 Tax=Tolypocladium paradoxum TaxID=94208 RepID=A0A2S4L8H8_9HYPO|nr:Uncharacterized protein TPAR_01045 [Tolypocladium paradoxum]